MTKKNKDDISEKEVYRLWWEYLKRSERYRLICEILTRLKLHKTARLNTSERNRLIKEYDKYAYNIDISLIIASTAWIPYNTYWQIYGNVFETKFEDVWMKGHMVKLKDTSATKLPVVDLRKSDTVSYIIFQDDYIRTSDEYLDAYLEPESRTTGFKKLLKSSVSYIFLGIPIVGTANMKSISAEIKTIRDSYMKTEKAKVCDGIMKQAIAPSGQIRLDELNFYLKVYDLRKEGLTMPQVIKKLRPEQSSDSTNVSRQFFSFQKKAKQIISNVEYGYFPGKY